MTTLRDPLFIGTLLALAAAIGVILHRYRRDPRSPLDGLDDEASRSSGLEEADRIRLRLEIGRARAEQRPWYERATSAVGAVAFVGTLGALLVQTVQNASLEQKSQLENDQLELFRAQSERAEKLLQPIVNSIITNFERDGARPDADQKELLAFAIDRWLTQPRDQSVDSRANLHRAFRAALITGDYSAALDAANALGEDFSRANPAEQVSLFEYAFVTGWGRAEADRVADLVGSESQALGRDAELRLLALARAVGAVDEAVAIRRVSRRFSISGAEAARRLEAQGVRLRRSREGLARVARAGRPPP